MTKLINTDTQEYPVSVSQFKALHRNVSFAIQIPFSDYNHAVVFEVPKPTPSSNLKTFSEGLPELTKLDTYQQTWIEVDMFADRTDDKGNTTTKSEQEAEHTASLLAKAKTLKIADIDAKTASDIIEIVGDATSQRNLLAEFLDAKEADKSVTIYKLKWSEVAELRASGNKREALVADALDIEEVSNI
mgnify:CR=1 FL=1